MLEYSEANPPDAQFLTYKEGQESRLTLTNAELRLIHNTVIALTFPCILHFKRQLSEQVTIFIAGSSMNHCIFYAITACL